MRPDGLYRIVRPGFIAGFELFDGQVVACAPILSNCACCSNDQIALGGPAFYARVGSNSFLAEHEPPAKIIQFPHVS